MTMSEAAKIILLDTNRPMTTKELVVEIESRGLFKFGAKNPSSLLSGALSKKSDTFIRTSPGTYAIRQN